MYNRSGNWIWELIWTNILLIPIRRYSDWIIFHLPSPHTSPVVFNTHVSDRINPHTYFIRRRRTLRFGVAYLQICLTFDTSLKLGCELFSLIVYFRCIAHVIGWHERLWLMYEKLFWKCQCNFSVGWPHISGFRSGITDGQLFMACSFFVNPLLKSISVHCSDNYFEIFVREIFHSRKVYRFSYTTNFIITVSFNLYQTIGTVFSQFNWPLCLHFSLQYVHSEIHTSHKKSHWSTHKWNFFCHVNTP